MSTAARGRRLVDQEEIPIDPTLQGLRDPKVERLFAELGVTKFTLLSELPIASIDIERGHRNQARIGPPLVKEHAEKYRIDRQNGANFPAIVVVPIATDGSSKANKHGKTHYAIDGNHRLDAYIANGDRTIPAYEVRADQATCSVLTMALNTLNGLPPDKNSRMLHAEAAMNRGMHVDQASKLFALPRSALQALAKRRDDVERVEAAGIDVAEWMELTTAARDLIARVHTDEGLREVFQLYRETGLPREDLAAVVTQVNETRAASKQRKIVDDLREIHAPSAARVAFEGLPGLGKQGRMTGAKRLNMIFGTITAFAARDPDFTFVRRLDERTRDEFGGRVKQAVATLQKVQQMLEDTAVSGEEA